MGGMSMMQSHFSMSRPRQRTQRARRQSPRQAVEGPVWRRFQKAGPWNDPREPHLAPAVWRRSGCWLPVLRARGIAARQTEPDSRHGGRRHLGSIPDSRRSRFWATDLTFLMEALSRHIIRMMPRLQGHAHYAAPIQILMPLSLASADGPCPVISGPMGILPGPSTGPLVHSVV